MHLIKNNFENKVAFGLEILFLLGIADFGDDALGMCGIFVIYQDAWTKASWVSKSPREKIIRGFLMIGGRVEERMIVLNNNLNLLFML